MLISEIFTSIDGESLRAGEVSTFIRTQGCPLRCKYCDSKYTWGKDDGVKEMSVYEIMNHLKEINAPRNITLTGGEPLVQPDADDLIIRLSMAGYNVCIETCGAVDFTTREWFVKNYAGVWVCADYKTFNSGMTAKMLDPSLFALLRNCDVLKFVVGSKRDLDQANELIKFLRDHCCNCYMYLSPEFGKITPKTIVEYMLENRLDYKVRFQLQLHKFVWDPNMRGV